LPFAFAFPLHFHANRLAHCRRELSISGVSPRACALRPAGCRTLCAFQRVRTLTLHSLSHSKIDTRVLLTPTFRYAIVIWGICRMGCSPVLEDFNRLASPERSRGEHASNLSEPGGSSPFPKRNCPTVGPAVWLGGHRFNGDKKSLSQPPTFTPMAPAIGVPLPQGHKRFRRLAPRLANRHIPLLEFPATHSKQRSLAISNRHTLGCLQPPPCLRSSVFACGHNWSSLAASFLEANRT